MMATSISDVGGLARRDVSAAGPLVGRTTRTSRQTVAGLPIVATPWRKCGTLTISGIPRGRSQRSGRVQSAVRVQAFQIGDGSSQRSGL